MKELTCKIHHRRYQESLSCFDCDRQKYLKKRKKKVVPELSLIAKRIELLEEMNCSKPINVCNACQNLKGRIIELKTLAKEISKNFDETINYYQNIVDRDSENKASASAKLEILKLLKSNIAGGV